MKIDNMAFRQANRLQFAVLFVLFGVLTVMPGFAAPPTGGTTKTEKGTEAKNSSTTKADPNDVVGGWVSDWGPVKFSKASDGSFSGSWEEGKDKKGKIENGKFDAKTGAFDFNFIETWSGLKGTAKLRLAANHHVLSGSWIRGDGKGDNKGSWTMHR